MPDMQEVFRMATQKVRPDPGFVDRQHENQRRQSRRRRAGALVLVAVLVIAGVVVGISTLRSGDEGKVIPGSAPTPTATPVLPLHSGALEPGTYVVSTLDPDFDAKYRITMDVPDGYEGFPDGSGVAKLGRIGQMAVGAWVIGDVYADPCRWETTLLDPPAASSVDALVAALADQKGLRVSTPTDITVDGFAGTSMERTVHTGTNLADCDGGHFRPWLGTDGGERYLDPGEHVRLWIIDVDGVPLVIDASLGEAGTSAQDRAAHIQIAESVRIDPR
ncbi:MAG TPA: hypothetical protein VHN56_06025 [Actinomycetota bacterium]|nr:hypothetical protein [Actinomycetota bacterium]